MSDPIVSPPPRVPRTPVFPFEQMLPSPITKGAGTVVSIDDDETMTVLIEDTEVPGVVWTGSRPVEGELIELEDRGDLVVAIREPDLFVEGGAGDAWHYVSVDEPEPPQSEEQVIGGNPPTQDQWGNFWSGTRWAATYDSTGVTLAQTEPGPAHLLSESILDIAPGQVFRITAEVSAAAAPAHDGRIELQVATQGDGVMPYDPDTVAFGQDGVPLVQGDTTVLSWEWTAPDTITPASGQGPPARMRVGIRVEDHTAVGGGEVTINRISVVRVDEGFPLGSIWFNPAIGVGAPSVITTAPKSGTFTYVDTTKREVPGSPYIDVDGYPDVYGICLVTFTGTIVLRESRQLTIGVSNLTGAVEQILSVPGLGGATIAQVPLSITGVGLLAPGQSRRFALQYQWGSTPGTAHTFIGVRGNVMVLPGGRWYTTPPEEPPWLRYWDGDSWRPAEYSVPQMTTGDVGQTPPAKVATTTGVSRSPASGTVFSSEFTFTATVAPASGTTTPTGTVTFQARNDGETNWRSIATVTLAGGKATHKRGWTSIGTHQVRAVYNASAAFTGSTSSAVAVTVNPSSGGGGTSTHTKTFSATWVQAYNGSGGQISGSGHDGAIHQGYYSATHGNRRSLIGFNVNLPAGAKVTKVILRCGNWQHWYYNGGGTLRVGWHDRPSKPGSFGVGAGDTAKSSHDVGKGSWSVNISGWANAQVGKAAFKGIAIGPGNGNGQQFYGYSAAGTGPWSLVVTYEA